jgi:hypothetical protein
MESARQIRACSTPLTDSEMIQGSKNAIAICLPLSRREFFARSSDLFATYKLPGLGAVGIPLARACPSEGPSLLPVYVSPRTSGQMFDIEIRHLQIKRYGPACNARSLLRISHLSLFPCEDVSSDRARENDATRVIYKSRFHESFTRQS